MTAFKPIPKVLKTAVKGNVHLELGQETYAEVVQAATKNNVSIKEFCRQAVRFALDSMESK